MLTESKDTIKSRMIRIASGLWGYPDTQDINSFDPVVGMIIGSLAEELYRLSGEIKKTDARIVEKLYDILFSQNIFTHFPAHALIKAKPTQPQVTVTENYQFYYIKKIPKTVNEETVYINKNIHFTPTAELRLFKGDIKFFSAGNQLFEISDLVKEPLASSVTGFVPDYSRIYIGLKLDNLIEKIDGLSLMFTVRNKQKEERFYSLISNATWKIGNKEVNFRRGFELEQPGRENALTEMFRKENDISYKTCSFINEFYNARFMKLENGNYLLKNFLQAGALPERFKDQFPSEIIKSLPRDILWIEIVLPQPLAPEIIGDLTVSLNCFPIVNRELNEFSYSLIKGTNIIPLNTEDLFFDIKTITDTKGIFTAPFSPFGGENSEEEGYLIRQGGIARFDTRDAKETINHLIDLIRDERAAFALLGTDMIASELKQLDQIISRLKQRLDASNVREDSNSYVLLNCKTDFERAILTFWSTSGEIANNIRADSRLTLYKGSDIDSNSVMLITSTFGGREKLSKEDKMNKMRRALLSKGRIVTLEDIKALCFEHFGNDLSRVEIKKGVQLDHSPVKGVARSLDIYLTLNKQNTFTNDDLNQKTDSLKVRLRQESINLLPFRVFVC